MQSRNILQALLSLVVLIQSSNAYAPGGAYYRASCRNQIYSPWNDCSLTKQAPRMELLARSRAVSCASAVVKRSAVEELVNGEEETAALEINETSLVKEEEPVVTLEKLVNAALLLACFGYALYTILNIDHGMTRGWSQSEIAMRIPLDNWNLYESSLSEKPIETKTTINVIIYLLGDWLSQTLFSKKNVLDFDAKRTLRNGLIGLCFGPLVALYYEWSDFILPVEAGLWNRVQKIFMDQTLYLSVKCSLYIMAVGLLGGEDVPTVTKNVKERILPIMFTAWKFWPLVHCITYGVIPARHRILWVNSVDLVWNAILASAARKDPNQPSDDEVDGETPNLLEGESAQEMLVAAFKGDIAEHAEEKVAVLDENNELNKETTSGTDFVNQ